MEVEKIVPNPFQPRREFDEQKLKELAESVQMYGILQPLTVTRNEIQREDGTFYTEYELIAGERRLRASKLAGLSQVPVIIREGEDSEQEKLELAIIENLQREDLNAVDRALAFKQLAETFGMSHTMVAKKVGRSREYVSNSIRLLALPDYMLNSLRNGDMAEGHARTLLMLNDRPEEQDVLFREILLKKLSVREVERIARKIATDKVRKKNPQDFDTELIEIEKKFTETLGTRVQIQKTDYGGRLTIDYFSMEDLEEMLKGMKKEYADKVGEAEESAKAILGSHTPLAMMDNEKNESDGKNEVGISGDGVSDAEIAFDNTEVYTKHDSDIESDIDPILTEEGEAEDDNEVKKEEEVEGEKLSRAEDNSEDNSPDQIEKNEMVTKSETPLISPEEPKTLLEEPEEEVMLPSPLSRPQIVAESDQKSPVYIRSVGKVDTEPVEAKAAEEEVKDDEKLSSDNKKVTADESSEKAVLVETETKTEDRTMNESEEKKNETPKPVAQIDDSGLYSIRNFGV